MGRFVKSPRTTEAVASLQVVPSGNGIDEPADAKIGSIRYDLTTNTLRVYNGLAWQSLTTSGSAPVAYNSFTADGIANVFGPVQNASFSPVILDPGQEPGILVFIDSIYQTPYSAYTFNGTSNITFSSVPPEFAEITVLYGFTTVA